MLPWSDNVADTPVARLAWGLQYYYPFEKPPHLAIEALALTIGDRYKLQPPLTLEDGVRFLEGLGIEVNPIRMPRLKGLHGTWHGEPEIGEFFVQINHRDAPRRQKLTIFHEFYEILRAHLHKFECGPFPPGMSKRDYIPERLARRFAAAVAMPMPFVERFIWEHGLDVPLLQELTDSSFACVVRRLLELISGQSQAVEDEQSDVPLLGVEVPFLAIRCALKPHLLMSDRPRSLCIDHVRSHQFSLRKDRCQSRMYLIPRKQEEWSFGELVHQVMSEEAPVFAHRVTGFDLFGERDLCALATPEWAGQRVAAVSICATPVAFTPHWEPVVERIGCLQLPRVHGLAGTALKTSARRRSFGELAEVREAKVRQETIDVEIYRPLRRASTTKNDPELSEDQETPVSQLAIRITDTEFILPSACEQIVPEGIIEDDRDDHLELEGEEEPSEAIL
jgi:hypothetical protein